jgi:hypothetical protein
MTPKLGQSVIIFSLSTPLLNTISTMKLALAFALVGSAAAFAPQASVSLSFVAS